VDFEKETAVGGNNEGAHNKGGDDWRFGVVHIQLFLWLLVFFIKMCTIFILIDGK